MEPDDSIVSSHTKSLPKPPKNSRKKWKELWVFLIPRPLILHKDKSLTAILDVKFQFAVLVIAWARKTKKHKF